MVKIDTIYTGGGTDKSVHRIWKVQSKVRVPVYYYRLQRTGWLRKKRVLRVFPKISEKGPSDLGIQGRPCTQDIR